MKLYIDIETYSATPIDAGVYRYVEDPDFRILMAAWSLDGGPVEVWFDNYENIPGLTDPAVTKVAHNAQFERICFSRDGFLPPEQWHDTMAIAAELGLPQALGPLSRRLGAEAKDEAGTRLINLFCVPRRGKRTLPEEKPMEWLDFVAYCEQDVATLIDVDRRLGGWPTATEHQVWLADQHINDTGIKVDVELARAAVTAAAANQAAQVAEISTLTGIENPNSGPQMLAWLNRDGVRLPNLQADTVSAALSGDLPDVERRVLELRQELALVAAKKFSAALGTVNRDGRARGGFRFHGAHTGRWTGRGIQLQNLPRHGFKLEVDAEMAIADLKAGLGADADTLKRLVRPVFTGPFTVVDYSAIEARVVAWLAGEEWALQAFRDGRDIYVETAERMGGLTRSQGKVAVLALGYNGSIGSLRAMGAEGSDSELKKLVNQWRRANPSIVQLWATLDQVFRTGGPVGEWAAVEKDGSLRRLRLPSGRAIHYHEYKPRLTEGPAGPTVRHTFWDARYGRSDTYGGRLTENATQAVARDIMAEALVRLVDAGYRVVGHIHDEILVETDEIDAVREIMVQQPSWAPGLPIDGAGFITARYRKD